MLRQGFNLLAWAALPLIVLNLLLIPESRSALPVYLGVFTMAIQLGLLLRSRGVGLSAYFTMVVASSFFAPVIYIAQQVVMAAFGWNSYSGESSVLLAGPSEETLKLLPLVAVLVFARNRAARFGIADHILLGTACGVGFGLAENVARALTDYSSTGLLDLFTTMEDGVGHQYSLFTLFPGWTEGWGMEGAGHAVWSGLVAGGIGIARRYGRVLFSPLVLFLLVWVTLDHMAYNQAVSLGARDLIPDPALLVHDLVGSGSATRPAFLVMVVLAAWLDYRTLRKVDDRLPPFPERKGTPSAPSSAFGTLRAELLLQWRVLRSDRSAFPQAMAFVRSRRELGYGLHRAAGGPRRDAPPGPLLWDTGARLHKVVAAGVLVLLVGGIAATLPVGGEGTPAFLAPQLESLASWWNNLSPGQQLLITAGGTAALMLIPGVGFWAALGWATAATTFAESGREIGRALREQSPGAFLGVAVTVASGYLIGRTGVGAFSRGVRLVDLGGGRFRSPAGLVYGPGSRHGTRLNHVLHHARPDSTRANHTVFLGGERGVLRTVDEAWTRRGVPEPGDPGAYVVDMGRVIGTNGETRVRLIVRPGTSDVITAYPV